ncbi:dTMP kinase [Fusibacter sp. JL216-2]|uniref:dTMP kinase n=1 Tax=Fusibacter sp. JL216-2 TaxID=3071453 RepID=UPI003D355702
MARKMPVISIEGGDGTGKTTMLEKLKSYLDTKDIDFMVTREPGGVRIAELIRDVIHNPDHTEMDPKTEALLYAAARRQHLVEKVVPAVKEGKLVIFDRYVDSSMIYQGYVRGLGVEAVYEMNRFATEDFMPDKTLLFDLDPAVGQERIHSSGVREVNRLDNEGMAFHMKVREGYLKLAKDHSKRIALIDASKSMDEVFEDVKTIIDDLLLEWEK